MTIPSPIEARGATALWLGSPVWIVCLARAFVWASRKKVDFDALDVLGAIRTSSDDAAFLYRIETGRAEFQVVLHDAPDVPGPLQGQSGCADLACFGIRSQVNALTVGVARSKRCRPVGKPQQLFRGNFSGILGEVDVNALVWTARKSPKRRSKSRGQR